MWTKLKADGRGEFHISRELKGNNWVVTKDSVSLRLIKVEFISGK